MLSINQWIFNTIICQTLFDEFAEKIQMSCTRGRSSSSLVPAYTQGEITCFRISQTWRKHGTPCSRYVYVLRKRERFKSTWFRHVSGTEMPSHVSVKFKPADFRCCSFPPCFCKRICSCLLHLLKATQDGFLNNNIVTSKRRATYSCSRRKYLTSHFVKWQTCFRNETSTETWQKRVSEA